MSDDDNEYDSDYNSEDGSSENEGDLISNKKPLFKPSIAIKTIGETKYDSEGDSEEEEEDDEDEDEQTGGVADNVDELDVDDEVDDDDDDDEDIELDEDGEPIIKESVKKTSKLVKPKKITQLIVEDDEDDEDDEYDNYLQKFDSEMRDNFILNYHPEARSHNYEEVKALARVSRDGRGIIIDPMHKTLPFLTKYEMTRVLGQRAKQLDSGAKAFVKVPLNVIDGYHIAKLELEQKKIPFIIKRPFPNGGIEYWHVYDLEIL